MNVRKVGGNVYFKFTFIYYLLMELSLQNIRGKKVRKIFSKALCPILNFALGVNFDPRGEFCPLENMLSPMGEILC
jgi:hypothetical protein